MAMTRHQKDSGTTIKPGPMSTTEPDLILTDEALEDLMVINEGNPAFIADTIVSFAVHENMGINLFRALEGMTQNPILRPRFAQMMAEARRSVEVYEQLQQHLGIPLGYISPAGRCTEAMDQSLIASFLTAGSADPLTFEMAAVNATFLASSMCVANVELLNEIASGISDEKAVAAIENAVSELEPLAREHLEWATNARIAMATTLGKSKPAEKAGNAAEAMYGKMRS